MQNELFSPALEATIGERAQDSRIIQAIMAEPWAITAKAMHRILAVALRQDLDPQAIDSRRPPIDRASGLRYGYSRGEGVGVLEIHGPVFRYANLFTELSGATSLELASRDLRALLDDDAVETLVIDFDSPGGQVNGTEELAEMIHAARDEKHIVAYVSGMAASAAYWMASAADRVVSNRTSEVGSIGAVLGVWKNDADSEVVEFVSAQSPKKRLDPTTDAGKAEYQRLIDSIAQVFVDTVARNRGVDVETVLKDFGQGGTMVGDESLKAGMVDSVMSFDSLISDLTGSGGNQSEVFMSGKTEKPSGDAGNREVTAEMIASDHPAIAEHFREQGVKSVDPDALREEGAQRERERIQAVQEQGMPGHEALIQTLMFDGKTTGEQAAVQILKAEKEKRGNVLGKLENESAAIQPTSEAAPAKKDSDGPKDVSETALQKAWDSDATLRAEFSNDFEGYVAYEQAHAAGKVKVLGGQRK